MSNVYSAECVTECQSDKGEPILPGSFIIHPDAWLLCMPGYRNAEPRFKPADEETAAKVAEELRKRQPVLDATLVHLQAEIDKVAAAGRLKIDPATGFFARDSNGELVGLATLTPLNVHVIETAAGYGLKPTPPAL